MATKASPRRFGIKHDEWRSNQLAVLKKVMRMDREGGGFLFAQMGTGSGKSAVATGMGHKQQVLTLVHTLPLLTQYEGYGFDVVRGRQEYPCVLPGKLDYWDTRYDVLPTAADCHYSPMTKCPVAEECPYIIAKNKALASNRMACTYRYAGMSAHAQNRLGSLVLDEAHDAAEELIAFNKFEVYAKTMKRYNLPEFPYPVFGEDDRGDKIDTPARMKIFNWLSQCKEQLIVRKSNKQDMFVSSQPRTHDSFTKFMNKLMEITTDWFLKIEDDKIVLQSLSAKQIAHKIFRSKKTILLMSATIGTPDPLAKALGIEKYETIFSPHPVPADYRRIYNLKLPNMTKRNFQENPRLYEVQARTIWNRIEAFPTEWRGVIVTTSYFKIDKLKEFLLPLNDKLEEPRNIIIQERGEKVSDVVKEFVTDPQPSDIMIGTIQGMGTGLDLYGDLARWIVIAGVPHVNPTDRYMKARRGIEGGQNYQLWTTYNSVVQACGRVARGERNEDGEWISNFAVLADGSAMTKRALKFYDEDFMEAIV